MQDSFQSFTHQHKGPRSSPATAELQQRAVLYLSKLGATRSTFFYNFRWRQGTFEAPGGFVAAFGSKTPFSRDFCVESNVGFGVSVVRVASHWSIQRELTPEIRETISRRVNKLICERSPRPPQPDESPDSPNWWPSLGRGGRIGLYTRRTNDDDGEPEWYVVVFAGCDEQTLEGFERELERFQGSPGRDLESPSGAATFLNALPLFLRMENLAERNRERLALQFAEAAGFEVKGHGKFKDRGASPSCDPETFAELSRPKVEVSAEARRLAREWLWEMSPGSPDAATAARLPPNYVRQVGWGYRFPERAPAGGEAGFSELFAGKDAAAFLEESEIERRNEYATALFSCNWNVLRRGEGRDEVRWYSECSPVYAQVVEYGDPILPVSIYRWSANSTASSFCSTLPAETMGAFPSVVPDNPDKPRDDVKAEPLSRHFSSDRDIRRNAQIFSSYATREVRHAEAEGFGVEFMPAHRSTLDPMIVRESNRHYSGVVMISPSAQAQPQPPAPPSLEDLRRALEAQCACRDFAYRAPG